MLVRTASIVRKESLKDKGSSIAMQIMVFWFCRVHLQVFLQPIGFDSQHFFEN